MNRRVFSVALLTASAASLTGCEDQPSATATLTNNPAVHEAMKALEDAVSSLENYVGDFHGGNNWRDVVPEVEADSTNVADALTKLKQALGYSEV
jgi:hypothetical protein